MANRINFTVVTDAPYSKEEIDNLTNNFLDFIIEEDGDVDTDSVEVSIVDIDSAEADAENQKKREIIQEFLKNAKIEARVFIAEPEGTGFETSVTLD